MASSWQRNRIKGVKDKKLGIMDDRSEIKGDRKVFEV